MWSSPVTYFVVLCALLEPFVLGDKTSEPYGIARFDFRGVKGYMTFRPASTGVAVTASLQGLPESSSAAWTIKRLPVDQTLQPSARCTADYLGPDLEPSSRYDLANGSFNATVEELDSDLFGRNGILGRSVALFNSDGSETVSCATIRSGAEDKSGTDQDAVVLQATFTYPIAGTVYFRQFGDEPVAIFGKVFWVRDMNTTLGHNWHVHMNVPSERYREGNCSDVGGHYDPFDALPPPNGLVYSDICNPSNVMNCEVGDVTGKHVQIDVDANPLPHSRNSFYFLDTFLNLTGENAVVERSLAIHSIMEGTPIIACAPLVQSETLKSMGQAPFGSAQDSPHEATALLSMLSQSNVEIAETALMTNDLCSADVYNPFPPENSASLGSEMTPDFSPVGSLSAKYELNNAGEMEVTELPVYGSNTIVGKTLVLDSGKTCTSLFPFFDESAVKAKATFADPMGVRGNVYFFQRTDELGLPGIITVIVDLYYSPASNMGSTTGHSWHIHQLPPVPESQCAGTIGGHYNPFDVSLSNEAQFTNYSSDCSPLSPLRCESGDLAGKFGKLNIDPPGSDRFTASYIDNNLYLSGAYTIIGRSVGLHLPASQGGDLFACAEVKQIETSSDLAFSISNAALTSFERVSFVSSIGSSSDTDGVEAENILLSSVARDDESGCTTLTFFYLDASVEEAANGLQGVESALCDLYANDECAASVCQATEPTDGTGPTDRATDGSVEPTAAGLLSLLLLSVVGLIATS